MRFELSLSLEDDAAAEDRAEVIRRALSEVAYAVQDDRRPTEGTVRDVNGNTIGAWALNPAGQEDRRA